MGIVLELYKDSIIKRLINRLCSVELRQLVDNIDFHKENINGTYNSNKNYKIKMENNEIKIRLG